MKKLMKKINILTAIIAISTTFPISTYAMESNKNDNIINDLTKNQNKTPLTSYSVPQNTTERLLSEYEDYENDDDSLESMLSNFQPKNRSAQSYKDDDDFKLPYINNLKNYNSTSANNSDPKAVHKLLLNEDASSDFEDNISENASPNNEDKQITMLKKLKNKLDDCLTNIQSETNKTYENFQKSQYIQNSLICDEEGCDKKNNAQTEPLQHFGNVHDYINFKNNTLNNRNYYVGFQSSLEQAGNLWVKITNTSKELSNLMDLINQKNYQKSTYLEEKIAKNIRNFISKTTNLKDEKALEELQNTITNDVKDHIQKIENSVKTTIKSTNFEEIKDLQKQIANDVEFYLKKTSNPTKFEELQKLNKQIDVNINNYLKNASNPPKFEKLQSLKEKAINQVSFFYKSTKNPQNASAIKNLKKRIANDNEFQPHYLRIYSDIKKNIANNVKTLIETILTNLKDNQQPSNLNETTINDNITNFMNIIDAVTTQAIDKEKNTIIGDMENFYDKYYDLKTKNFETTFNFYLYTIYDAKLYMINKKRVFENSLNKEEKEIWQEKSTKKYNDKINNFLKEQVQNNARISTMDGKIKALIRGECDALKNRATNYPIQYSHLINDEIKLLNLWSNSFNADINSDTTKLNSEFERYQNLFRYINKLLNKNKNKINKLLKNSWLQN